MGEYIGRIEIARPPAEVFAFLSDLGNMPRYLPTVTVKMDGRHVPDEWRPYWNVTLDR